MPRPTGPRSATTVATTIAHGPGWVACYATSTGAGTPASIGSLRTFVAAYQDHGGLAVDIGKAIGAPRRDDPATN